MYCDQDETLRRAVQCFNGKNWKKIGELLFIIGLNDHRPVSILLFIW
jgi:hypothetical protein